MLRELARFMWRRKLYWLLPIVIALLLVGALIVLGELSPMSPFVYTLF